MALYRAKEIKAAYGGTQPDPNAPWGGYYADSVNKTHGSNAWIYRSFLWYDLSSIPYKSTITSAKLYVFCNYHNDNAANAKHNFSRVTETWEEETLTWNNMPSVDSRLYCDEWQSAPTLNSWNNWDITPLVQEWVDQTYPNYGLQVVNQSESVYRYDWFFLNRRHSSEYATYIEIEYEPSEEVKITKIRLQEIANQARRLGNVSGDLSLEQIESTLSGVNIALQEKTVNPTEAVQEVTPDPEYYGLSKVKVGAVIPEQLPQAENSAFGENDDAIQKGIVTPGSIVTGRDGIQRYGWIYTPAEAFNIIGFRAMVDGKWILLRDANNNDLYTAMSYTAGEDGWYYHYLDNPIMMAAGEQFSISLSGYKSWCMDSKDTVFNGICNAQPAKSSANWNSGAPLVVDSLDAYGAAIDIVISTEAGELPTVLQIDRLTLDAMAAEVKRITGTRTKVNTAQIITALQAIPVQTTE